MEFSDALTYARSNVIPGLHAMLKKRSKVTVLLDPEEFERFEAFCVARGHKKSTLVARLIREHLDSEGFRSQRELPLDQRET